VKAVVVVDVVVCGGGCCGVVVDQLDRIARGRREGSLIEVGETWFERNE
jgi:hypothetical protein